MVALAVTCWARCLFGALNVLARASPEASESAFCIDGDSEWIFHWIFFHAKFG